MNKYYHDEWMSSDDDDIQCTTVYSYQWMVTTYSFIYIKDHQLLMWFLNVLNVDNGLKCTFITPKS